MVPGTYNIFVSINNSMRQLKTSDDLKPMSRLEESTKLEAPIGMVLFLPINYLVTAQNFV